MFEDHSELGSETSRKDVGRQVGTRFGENGTRFENIDPKNKKHSSKIKKSGKKLKELV